MATPAASPRPRRLARLIREAAGGPMTQFLIFGCVCIGGSMLVGLFLLWHELQAHAGAVGRLQQEIRGLTNHLERRERTHEESAARAAATIRTLEERRQWTEVSHHVRGTHARLESLERQLDRQMAAMRLAQSACLAEFEPYRRDGLAVPVDRIAQALERMIEGRLQDLTLLISEVRTHLSHERLRIAEMRSDWRLGDASLAPSPATPVVSHYGPAFHSPASLSPTLRNFEDLAATPGAALVEMFRTGEDSRLPDDAAGGEANVVRKSPAPDSAAASSRTICAPMPGAPDLIPIPDATVPRGNIARSAAPSAVRPQRRTGYLSFASGRRVDTSPREVDFKATAELPPTPFDVPSVIER